MQRGAFAAPSLHAALAELPDKRDRSLVTELTYGSLRWQIWLEAALKPQLKAPERLPERVRIALQLGAYEVLVKGQARFAVVNEWVNIIKKREPKLAGLVNAVLRRVQVPVAPGPELAVSLPDWLYREFERSLGQQAGDAARGMLEPEPLWLAALQPQAQEILRVEDTEVWPGPVQGSLGARLSVPLAELESYLAGLVQPMNPTSLLAARMLGAGEGDAVLDLASGHGIKAAVLASLGAEVTSVELDADKLKRARRNLKRLQLKVRHVQADLREPPAELAPAEFVLLDAPCTGTGTLRGNPEIKLRLRPADVAKASALQSELLASAGKLVAPGGRLLYAVCSLTQAEGPDAVAAFLDANPEFSAMDARSEATKHAGPELQSLTSGAGIFVLPTGGLDGFYLALLQRRD